MASSPCLCSPLPPCPHLHSAFSPESPLFSHAPFLPSSPGMHLYVAFLQTLTLTFLTSPSPSFLLPPPTPKWPASLALSYSPGFPGAHRDPHASASRVIGLEACANRAQQMFLNPIKLTMEITLCGSPAGQMWSVCPGREHSLGWGGGASSS